MLPDQERICSGPLPERGARVAVGVRYFRGYDQWHAGIAYRTDDGEAARWIHLENDLQLTDVALDDDAVGWRWHYVWVEPVMTPEKAREIAQVCRRVARCVADEGQRVRYSVRHHLGRFDADTGRYMPAAGERGLTCATCVLALCRGGGFELVDIASWPPREEDGPWIASVVTRLGRRDAAHAANVASNGLCARFRPTEVAGACLAPTLPIAFAEAVKLAETLRARYDEHFPAPRDL